jgi:hypothetical protein
MIRHERVLKFNLRPKRHFRRLNDLGSLNCLDVVLNDPLRSFNANYTQDFWHPAEVT